MWDFVAASITGPAFSFGATLTRNGAVFLNTGFGGVNPQPSVCVSVGALNQRNPDPATVDAYLSGWGSSLNYPTLGFGFGNVFSRENPSSAQVINFGTPSFGGGNASYGTPIFNIYGR